MQQYSPKNQAFLLAQMPTATDVRPFKAWKAAGRSVIKGEKALRVWIPKRGKAIPTEIAAATGTASEETMREYFVRGPVFDISQTQPTKPNAKRQREQQSILSEHRHEQAWTDYAAAIDAGDIPADLDFADWYELREETIRYQIAKQAEADERARDYTIATTAGAIIAQVEHHDIYAPIGGGSQELDEQETAPAVSDITITHTPAGGTLATGDTRPYAAILKANRWKWGRSIAAWYVPNSRDRIPNHWAINATADALTAAGATVAIDLDESLTDPTEREANRAERLDDRRDALTAKAERHATQSTEHYQRSHDLAQLIPFGQPILVGHHSEAGHRRDLARIHRHMDKSCEHQAIANESARRATASERSERHRMSAPATMRRLKTISAEIRKLERNTTGYEPTTDTERLWLHHATLRLDSLRADHAYWQQHLDQLKADGYHEYTAADFKPGDLVKTRFGWRRVVRVNKQSLSVETDYSWTDTVPYDEVRDSQATN